MRRVLLQTVRPGMTAINQTERFVMWESFAGISIGFPAVQLRAEPELPTLFAELVLQAQVAIEHAVQGN